MTKNKKRYLTKRYVIEDSTSEIDFDLYDFFKLKENDTVEFITKVEKPSTWGGESYPININLMIDSLKQMKEKLGCNFVEIMYHTDHIGYVINGLIIEDSNASDITENINKLKKQKIIQTEMDNLVKSYKKLEAELKSL